MPKMGTAHIRMVYQDLNVGMPPSRKAVGRGFEDSPTPHDWTQVNARTLAHVFAKQAGPVVGCTWKASCL